MNIPRYALTLLAIPLTTSSALAVDFNVFFEDTSTGVDWTGVVDTTTDTLSISQWNTTGNEFYLGQSSLPIIFNAVTGSDGSFDIPDTWDGTLTNWGFVSENPFTTYQWTDRFGSEIAFDLPNTNGVGVGVIETYIEESIIGSGKGATVTPARVDRTYTNSAATHDPINSRTLTATTFTTTSAEAVPEPSSAMLLLVGAAGALTRRKR